jgi:hypothetical protein
MSRRARKAERGFTILEVIFAAALACVSMMATLEMVKFMDRANRSVSAGSNFQALTNHVGLVFSQSATCNMSNLINRVIPGTLPYNLNPIVSGGSTVLAVGDVAFGFRVTSIELDQIISTANLAGGDKFLIANFHLTAEKEENSQVGPKELDSNTKVAIVVDASNRVKNCGNNITGLDVGSILRDSCEQAGGTFDATLHQCIMDAVFCAKGGGVWNTSTLSCDWNPTYYAVTANCVGAPPCVIDANCASGDFATGGGPQTPGVADISQSWPNLVGGRATGWHCGGQTVTACHVVCHRKPS